MAGELPNATAFFDVWHTYQKVVAAGHMYHREIAASLRQLLGARFGTQPLTFLDFGCGDAAALEPVLRGLTILRYKGVDLSETALAFAAKTLAAQPCEVELVHGDILDELSKETSSYDVIHCSFALHHLPAQEKARFFRHAERCLDMGGLLLLVDVMREEGESLESYLQHYCSWLRGNFNALDAQELDLACDHIMKNDLPEPPSVLRAQALAAGLGKARQEARFNRHHVLSFARD